MAGFVHLATNLLNFILTYLHGKFKHLFTSQNGLYSIVLYTEKLRICVISLSSEDLLSL